MYQISKLVSLANQRKAPTMDTCIHHDAQPYLHTLELRTTGTDPEKTEQTDRTEKQSASHCRQ